MLLLTEKVIKMRAYHSQECAVTWETCDLRKYLNDDFYHAFGDSDRARVLKTAVVTKVEEVIRYFGDSGQLQTRYMYPNCDWSKNTFLPWIDDQYNINRRAVDNAGIVRLWRLRSPGSNAGSTAYVAGFVGDEFDHGELNIGNAD